jgi:hypothetical protein
MGSEFVVDEHGADLANLVGFRAATLFGLKIDQDGEPRAGEDMMPAGRKGILTAKGANAVHEV